MSCVCGKTEPGHECSGCHAQYYCGGECQAADWPRHQAECVAGVLDLFRRKPGSGTWVDKVKNLVKKKTPEQTAAAQAIVSQTAGLNDAATTSAILAALKSGRFIN